MLAGVRLSLTRRQQSLERKRCRTCYCRMMGPTETLLKTLAGYDGAFERIDVAMRDIVDILRDRGVSWSTLGETLAVSRQAAWKRFG
jgi:hypothetical protein